MTDHLISYGEMKSEWHEGAPDWAIGPPKFINEVFCNKILLMEKRDENERTGFRGTL